MCTFLDVLNNVDPPPPINKYLKVDQGGGVMILNIITHRCPSHFLPPPTETSADTRGVNMDSGHASLPYPYPCPPPLRAEGGAALGWGCVFPLGKI